MVEGPGKLWEVSHLPWTIYPDLLEEREMDLHLVEATISLVSLS